MGNKRGGAVMEAPEDTFASERGWRDPDPAPAGAHQRASAGAFTAGDLAHGEDADETYAPQRGSFRFRLQGGVPRSLTGRILMGTASLLFLGGLLAGAVAFRQFLLRDPQFLLTTSADIQITGNRHLTRAQALSVFGADLERNIFRIPLAQRRDDLERLPWVAHATVMRILPNHLRLALTERTPVAFVRQGSRIGLVDGAGVLLDMPADAAGDPHYSFPVLTGLAGDDTAPTRASRMEVYHRFLSELDQAKNEPGDRSGNGPGNGPGEKLSRSISEVDVANPEDVKAIVTDGANDILVHFGDENFLDRYRAFQAHLPEWKTQYPKLASADMRYERQVVLEMQPGSGVPLNRETSAAPEAVAAKATAPGRTSPVKTAAANSTLPKLAPKPVGLAGAKAGAKPAGNNAKLFAALAAAHRAEAGRKAGVTSAQ